MYFLRLNHIIGHKKTFIFGEVKKTENPYYGIYEIYLKDGIGFYNNHLEYIKMVEANDLRECLPLEKIDKTVIKYLFGE